MRLRGANFDDTNKLWHQWLGHIKFGTLQNMSCLRMADKLLHIKLHTGVYEKCMLGGHHHDFFPKDLGGKSLNLLSWFIMIFSCLWPLLHLVGLDVSLPSLMISPTSFRYILFIPRMKYLRNSRNKIIVKNHSDHNIKSIRTVEVGEHLDDGFHPFLTSHCIVWKNPISQQDGIAHWSNRAIIRNVLLYVALCLGWVYVIGEVVFNSYDRAVESLFLQGHFCGDDIVA